MRITPLTGGLVMAVSMAALSFGAAPNDTRIVDAAKNQDKSEVQALLKQKVNVNATEPDGTNALLWAVRANDLSLAQMLIAAGANVNAINRYGVAPISEAANNGSAPVLEALLTAGADANAVAGEGETALMTAARSGNAGAVETLLAHGADVNAKEQWHGQSALMWAAAENHADVVRVLLKHGAAIADKSAPIVRGKISTKVASDRHDDAGGLTALIFASRNGSLEAAQALLEGGADINETSFDQSTPLIASILNDHDDVARYLIEHGADLNKSDKIGAGPLYMAVNMRNLEHSNRPRPPQLSRDSSLEIIKLLLDKGANPNARLSKDFPVRGLFEYAWTSTSGATPFVRAAKSNDLTVMRLLLEHGADPNIPTTEKTTAFMFLAGVGWEDLQSIGTDEESIEGMKLCLEKGADVNAVNTRGQAAIHGAAHRDSPLIVQFLADHGANLLLKDRSQHTALSYAEGLHLSGSGQGYHPNSLKKLQELLTARGQLEEAQSKEDLKSRDMEYKAGGN